MRPFSAVRSVVKNDPNDRPDYPNVIVYHVQRRMGMRFRLRRFDTVQTWNKDVDLNTIDRGRVFANTVQPLDSFVLFAKCSKFQI